jgi:antitoxin VapB
MLNIKNPRAHELAVKVAATTGESLTAAVIHSLEERLERVTRKHGSKSPAEMALALDRIASVMPRAFFEQDDPTAFLYDDETGGLL